MCNTWKSPKFSRSQIFNPGTKFTEPDVENRKSSKGSRFSKPGTKFTERGVEKPKIWGLMCVGRNNHNPKSYPGVIPKGYVGGVPGGT